MKKLLLVFIMVLSLTACKSSNEVVEEIEFNGVTYNLEEVSSLGYDMFVGEGHLIEIKYEEDSIILSTEIDGDIFIVTGTTESYDISKNGTIILIDGADLTPTGIEFVEWNEDIIEIIDQYEEAYSQ